MNNQEIALEEKKAEEFFEKGEWIRNPELNSEDAPSAWLWENFKAAAEFHKQNPHLHVYTLVESEGMWLVKGARFVNRFAYLFSAVEPPLDEDGEIMYWPPDHQCQQCYEDLDRDIVDAEFCNEECENAYEEEMERILQNRR